jgi:hypothetical protein
MSEEIRRGPIAWEPWAAIACFVVGAVSLALGALLTTRWLLNEQLHPFLHDIGLVLLIIGLPTIILGGHCMDLQDKKRGKSNSNIKAVGIVLFLLAASNSRVQAQQTIFNVPSTDVLDRGKVYAELDASLKLTDGSDVKKFSSFVPRVVVGVGNQIEIGLNLTGNIQPDPDSTTLVPTFKWKAFQNEHWAMVMGDNVFIPMRNRTYDAGNYVYAELSRTFTSGTRITFGAYDFTRNVVASANRAGEQFGFEQPLNKTITIAADWFTGKHTAGYFTPGIIFKAGPKVTGYASYSIGNENASGGNHFFLLELGYNFN